MMEGRALSRPKYPEDDTEVVPPKNYGCNVTLTSTRSRVFANPTLSRFQNVFDAADRDDDPIGPIIQFVADFVDRFIEEISLEKNLKVV
jgi:hypothetical protein